MQEGKGSDRIQRVLHKHGHPRLRLWDWFDNFNQVVDYVESERKSGITPSQVQEAMDDYEKPPETLGVNNAGPHQALFEDRNVMLQWMSIIDDTSFNDVRAHFFKDRVD